MPHALVRRPGPRLAEGIVTHQERVPVDVARATEQWEGYVESFVAAGWGITEVEPVDECPDAVFVEDALVVVDDLAVVTRPGASSRRAETRGPARVARDRGLEIARIVGPGTLDGGDVLKVGRIAYVGVGGRTNREGVEQLRGLIAPMGWSVEPVPVTRVLHLKSAVTALPDGTVVGHPDLVDDPGAFPSFLPVPEAAGSHVVHLDERTVLMAAGAPASAAMICERGYDVVEIDISEFEKLEGCVTCLSVRHRG